ncbi:MAG: putative glucosyl-3-phosphoglycerate synthase [Ignavibacteria bacterium]|nr:putative glucosyl-3-phosphoglycerate synthase [Ignavibacteria bacterium]
MQVKLSVVIITYNEEINIGRCLESVKEIADEIVVLDSFSSDRTEEICRNYNAKFEQHAFDDFVQQKNRAVTLATFPHILSLDADEALSPELFDSIKEIKNNFNSDGYYFNRLTNYCGKWIRHCGWYPDQKLRIWDSQKGKWSGVQIHEKVEMEPGASIQFIKGDLLHYSYYSISQHIKQVNYFTEIGADAAFQNGMKPSLMIEILNPPWKFFRDYVIKLGFLDGWHGFVICVISAHATFLKYVKLRQLHNKRIVNNEK